MITLQTLIEFENSSIYAEAVEEAKYQARATGETMGIWWGGNPGIVYHVTYRQYATAPADYESWACLKWVYPWDYGK